MTVLRPASRQIGRTLHLRRAMAVAAIAGLGAIFSAGCSDVQTDFCEKVCECQACGEKGQERCDVGVQSQLDIAETYGCLQFAEAFYDCAINTGVCTEDEQFEVGAEACQNERHDYDDCTADSSRRSPGAYPD